MLMAGINVLYLDAGRHHELLRQNDREAARAYQADLDTCLFQNFPPRRVVRKFVVFDVATRWQPAAQLAVVVEQDAPSVDDEDGDGEVAQDLARGDRRMGGHARGPVYPVERVALEAVADRLLAADAALAAQLNAAVSPSPSVRMLTSRLATGLAGVEVTLMGGLALGGGFRSAARMLTAVAVVYLASEALGTLWPRQRPFARLSRVQALVSHESERSFPSRHVASGLAMAAIGGGAHPRLGLAMAAVAWTLGVSRVAAGLHYPSDVLAGAALGGAIGRLLATHRERSTATYSGRNHVER
jgi:membrane-associated phospholipid phosphatase